MTDRGKHSRFSAASTDPPIEEAYRRIAQLHYALATADSISDSLHHHAIDDLMDILEMLEPSMPPQRAGHSDRSAEVLGRHERPGRGRRPMSINTQAAERADLHVLVDALPDSELGEARRFLSALANADPVLRAALTAPVDDEPFTDEDREAVEEAEAGYRRGEWVTNEQMKRELGL